VPRRRKQEMLISQRPTLSEEVLADNGPVHHRTAGARLRLHPRQLAAGARAVVHPGRGGHQHPHRRCAARVHHRSGVKEDVTDIILNPRAWSCPPRRTSRSPCTAQAGPGCGHRR
jgi:hypothetical protein